MEKITLANGVQMPTLCTGTAPMVDQIELHPSFPQEGTIAEIRKYDCVPQA